MSQAPPAVVLVRPHHFRPNPQTAADNTFQAVMRADPGLARAAAGATTRLAERLAAKGVEVNLFEDHTGEHPDSVFPNNWFSTHEDGRVVVYPMYAANRRGEPRPDVIDRLQQRYRVAEVIDLAGLATGGRWLEGTGAMVLDRVGRVAYVARSLRADPALAREVCLRLGYQPHVFAAVDPTGMAIYHTNVMLSVATEFVLVGLDSVVDPIERAELTAALEASGRTLIPLSQAQLGNFAANAIELQGAGGRLLALSSRAERALTRRQKRRIERSCELVPVDVAPIELAGGSVRCMIAGIHLSPRPALQPA